MFGITSLALCQCGSKSLEPDLHDWHCPLYRVVDIEPRPDAPPRDAEELARVIDQREQDLANTIDEISQRIAGEGRMVFALDIAHHILAAGYARRADVLEEAAKVADAFASQWQENAQDAQKTDDDDAVWRCQARVGVAKSIAAALRAGDTP